MVVSQVKHARMPGKLVIVGFGCIGKGTLPLILRHLEISPSDITIINPDETGKKEAETFGVHYLVKALTPSNYRAVLDPLLHKKDFLLNLSVNVSSKALVELCREKGALYLDTCIEPWEGGYLDTRLSPEKRTNYALREEMLALQKEEGVFPTAVVCHGANPGLVSHLVKQALLNIAADLGKNVPLPKKREEWAALAKELGIKVIHIAERDSQVASTNKKRGEFVNTWSVDGFTGEGCQPAELGWGSHETALPEDGKEHLNGCGAAIYLNCPGASVRVRTWTPKAGPFHGFLITHNEAISISDYYTLKDKGVTYRPTCHYAYHPCDDAVVSLHEFAGASWKMQEKKRMLMEEIVEGTDELGVLLMGHPKGAYWYGSLLGIDEARKLAPYNNATSLQVSVSVLSGMVWAIENPECGVVEADQIDFKRNLEVATPYLGKLVGEYSSWTPLEGRSTLFKEKLDTSDPWQFNNFRVH